MCIKHSIDLDLGKTCKETHGMLKLAVGDEIKKTQTFGVFGTFKVACLQNFSSPTPTARTN